MTLQEAWYKLLDLDNFNKLSPSQVFSILSDFGVFTVYPKLKIAIKTALNYGLWNIVIKTDNAHQISILRSKLENDGFADNVIDDIIASFIRVNNKPTIIGSENLTNIQNSEKLDSLENEKYNLPFHIKKGIDENITTFASNSNDEIKELNKRLYIVPEWNDENGIIINELSISDKKIVRNSYLSSFGSWMTNAGIDDGKKRYCLSYDITGNPNRPQTNSILPIMVKFYTIIVSTSGRIHSKKWVTSINLKDKYAISSGEYELEIDIPFEQIDSIVLMPENGDLDLADVDYNSGRSILDKSPVRDFKNYKSLHCPITFEPAGNVYTLLDIQLSDFKAWGSGNSMSIAFLVKGSARYQSGYRLGNSYIIAIFNHLGKLVDTLHVFIGKTGYVGPRGGLHDTYMNGGLIKTMYLMYYDIKVNAAEISKIIISPSN